MHFNFLNYDNHLLQQNMNKYRDTANYAFFLLRSNSQHYAAPIPNTMRQETAYYVHYYVH